jgi:phytoene dehydrogenase-like protein
MKKRYDAVVIGSGPNGLAAGIAMIRAGYSVHIIEAAATIGGGSRSASLTLPGFVHDVCSAIHPMAVASPFFQELPLEQHGLSWIHPIVPLAHPLDGDRAVVLDRSLEITAGRLGIDESAYGDLMSVLVSRADILFRELVGPFRLPRHPILALRFAWRALRSGSGLARHYFRTEEARALIAGLAGHALLPLEQLPGAAIGLMLGVAAHAVGWPMPRGGAQAIPNALASYFRSLGGEITTGRRIHSLDELPRARVVVLDVTPRQLLAISGDRLPLRYRRQLQRYRYGMGIFKVDWALSAPIPWRAEGCRRAGTLHLGGTLDELALSERSSSAGRHPEKPFVLLAQPTLFDASRAPAGRHVAWGYCHVPNGSTFDMTERIEAQVERFAPGFRQSILARHTMNTNDMERYNPNYIGGDINGGMADIAQLFTRPVLSLTPYTVPSPGLFLCSSSTPPGGGVHGMCGYFAARAAMDFLRRGRKRN